MPTNDEDKKPEVTFRLTRVEELDDDDRSAVEGMTEEMTEGLVIKEYKSGSFVKLRRFIPNNSLFVSQVTNSLTADHRSKITQGINNCLEL